MSPLERISLINTVLIAMLQALACSTALCVLSLGVYLWRTK